MFTLQVNADTFELSFARALADDNGNWAVIARNAHGEMSQFFTFSAQMLPRFKMKISDLEANESKQVHTYGRDDDVDEHSVHAPLTDCVMFQVVFKCQIECVPPPKVQWFKDDTEITKDPRVKCYKVKLIKMLV